MILQWKCYECATYRNILVISYSHIVPTFYYLSCKIGQVISKYTWKKVLLNVKILFEMFLKTSCLKSTKFCYLYLYPLPKYLGIFRIQFLTNSALLNCNRMNFKQLWVIQWWCYDIRVIKILFSLSNKVHRYKLYFRTQPCLFFMCFSKRNCWLLTVHLHVIQLLPKRNYVCNIFTPNCTSYDNRNNFW